MTYSHAGSEHAKMVKVYIPQFRNKEKVCV